VLRRYCKKGFSAVHHEKRVKAYANTHAIRIVEVPDSNNVNMNDVQTAFKALSQEIGARCETVPVF
jgi:hypothetical protein